MIRAPGLAGDPPGWFGRDADVPRAVHAGPWIAQHGQFFDGWGRRADHAELPQLAATQAARTGWAKVIGDWMPGDDVLPVDVLRRVVAAVHAVGGRVAVHSQHAAGGAAAVAAGVDSLEHGMCLDPGLLSQMARQGTALTPTLSVITGSLAEVRRRPGSPRKQWYLAGATAHGQLAAEAAGAGVTLLAGTDSRPCGRVLDENPRPGRSRSTATPGGRGGLLGRTVLSRNGRAGRRSASRCRHLRRRSPPRPRPAGSTPRGRAARQNPVPAILTAALQPIPGAPRADAAPPWRGRPCLTATRARAAQGEPAAAQALIRRRLRSA